MANSTERSALAAAILVVYKDALTLLLFVSHGIKPTPYWTNSCDWLVTFQFCWKIPSEWEGARHISTTLLSSVSYFLPWPPATYCPSHMSICPFVPRPATSLPFCDYTVSNTISDAMPQQHPGNWRSVRVQWVFIWLPVLQLISQQYVEVLEPIVAAFLSFRQELNQGM